MKIITASIIISFFLNTGCNSSRQTGSKTVEKPIAEGPAPAPAPDQPVTLADDGSEDSREFYRLIVSFISIGEGIDSKARENLNQVITNWRERTAIELEMIEIPWGREGEVDLCFPLTELNPEEQAIFIDEMKLMFKGNSLVQISENQKGRGKK